MKKIIILALIAIFASCKKKHDTTELGVTTEEITRHKNSGCGVPFQSNACTESVIIIEKGCTSTIIVGNGLNTVHMTIRQGDKEIAYRVGKQITYIYNN